jgi:F420-non-reducing hydrogenase large subunit
MSLHDKTLIIEPVTRIEGEARVIITLDDANRINNVYYQVLELRGFEAFCRGRLAEEMPRISQAICGVCSIAHHMASAKAVDRLFGRKPTETAIKLRELIHNIYMIDDHLLHLIVMALPDLFVEKSDKLGGFISIVKGYPEVVKRLITAKSITAAIIKKICGKIVHIPIAIPGGVSKRLSKEDLEFLEAKLKELRDHLQYSIELFKGVLSKSLRLRELMMRDEYELKTYYMGLVDEDGSLNFYDGVLRVIDYKGNEVFTFKPEEYMKYIAEHYEGWSYSKFPYLIMRGWQGLKEGGIVRVGPLARLNVCNKVSTEWASNEYKEMCEFFSGKKVINNTLAYHWARLVENIYALEVIEKIITEDKELLTNGEVVNLEGTPIYEGVGIVEAARGVLIHHYKSNSDFIITEVNVITPTAINNAAINVQLRKIAMKFGVRSLTHEDLTSLVNELEVAIRAFDPCNSCATHVAGSRLIKVFIYDSHGNLLKVI